MSLEAQPIFKGNETALANISAAKQYLAEARNLTDVLKIRDMAVAAQAWATARGADEAVQMAMEIKLRSKRKAGEFLADMKEEGIIHKGERSHKAQDVTFGKSRDRTH